jgi:hypothetical protein
MILKYRIINHIQVLKPPYPIKMKTKIHVNQHNIRSNKQKGTDLPVITIKRGKENIYCNEVEILGPSKIIYGGDGKDAKPLLSCGARVIIETESEINIIG